MQPSSSASAPRWGPLGQPAAAALRGRYELRISRSGVRIPPGGPPSTHEMTPDGRSTGGIDSPIPHAVPHDARKHQGRILANMNEGEKRQVGVTPTFIIGSKSYPGALPYDQIKAIVDSATQTPAAK